MQEKEFKSRFPKLVEAISQNQMEFDLYGIKFKSHSVLTIQELYQKYEPLSSLRFYRTKYLIEGQFMIGLN